MTHLLAPSPSATLATLTLQPDAGAEDGWPVEPTPTHYVTLFILVLLVAMVLGLGARRYRRRGDVRDPDRD